MSATIRLSRSQSAGDGEQQLDASRAQRQKRVLSKSACGACRVRKSKCDNQRPVCESCQKSGKECIFDTELGETRQKAVKRRAEFSEHRAEVFEQRIQTLNLILEQVSKYAAWRQMQEAVADMNPRNGFDAGAALRKVVAAAQVIELSIASRESEQQRSWAEHIAERRLPPPPPLQRSVDMPRSPGHEVYQTSSFILPVQSLGRSSPRLHQSTYSLPFVNGRQNLNIRRES